MLITLFAPENVHLLEIASVRDALFEANCRAPTGKPYQVRLVTERGIPARSASGVTFVPDAGIEQAIEPSDTLIVVGPYGVPSQPNEQVTQWLRDQAQRSRRYGSTCTGAFSKAPPMVKIRTERALGYVRVSTQRQAEGGISMANQEERLTAHNAQRGVEYVDTYRDGGLSGTTDNRPGLQARFEHALRPGGAITEIRVYSFSRFFRDHYLLEHYRAGHLFPARSRFHRPSCRAALAPFRPQAGKSCWSSGS